MNEKINLKCCPFCGESAKFQRCDYPNVSGDLWIIRCAECQADCGAWSSSKSVVAEKWNTRIYPEPLFEIVE